MIDYALWESGQRTLDYIGHSQGTTAFFVMASERKEMNAKIRTMHAFGKDKNKYLCNGMSEEMDFISFHYWMN